MKQKLEILQLCNKPPLPAVDGGCIAMNNVTQGLLELGHNMKLLSIFTHKHDFDEAHFPDSYMQQTDFEGVFVDTKINVVDAFSNLVLRDSYNVSRFFSPDFDRKLVNLLKRRKFDIIHLESLFMTPYIGTIRRHCKARLVLRSHNLEYIIWNRMAKGTKSFPKRTYLNYLSKILKDYEVNVMNQVDGIAAITEEDKSKYEKLGFTKPIINIPFGVKIDKYMPGPPCEEVSLFHLGSMDWFPNMEGITWFLDKVWPLMHAKYPGLLLYLAGRKMPDDLKAKAPEGVRIVGEVEDAQEFMKSKSIMVVPLLSAGGVRVKIIEGMALAKPIIASPEGAEGIDYTHGENILIAEKPSEYVEALSNLLDQPSRITGMGTRARELAESHFDNARIMEKLEQFYYQLLA